MTYETVEVSVESGTPFFLYEFNTPNTTYRFTSLFESHTVNSEVWNPVAVSHGVVKQSNDISKNSINITLDSTDNFCLQFRDYIPDHNITVNIHRGHVGESNTEFYWKGRVSSYSFKLKNIVFDCESIFTSLKRYAIREMYTKTCRHTLYSRGCNLDKENFSHVSYIGGLSKLSLTLPNDEVDGFFGGGIVKFNDGSVRGLSSHVGDVCRIGYKSEYLDNIVATVGYGLSYGEVYGAQPVLIYPGCDKTLDTCTTKFSNNLNNGGFKWIPDTNPMDGSSIV